MTNHEQAIEKEVALFKITIEQTKGILGDVQLAEVGEKRGDTEVPNVTTDQVEALYEVMEPLGFGRESDVTPEEAGLQNGYAVNLEGGRVNKIKAELAAVLASGVQHGPIVLTLTSERKADEGEHGFLQSWGIQDTSEVQSELDAGVALLHTLPNFEATEPRAVAFGYDAKTLEMTDGSDANQAVYHGQLNGQPVFVLEVTRNHTEDGKYTQPNTGDMLRLSTEMLRQQDLDVSQIAVATGGLYMPTRRVDTINANRAFAAVQSAITAHTIAYGRDTMGAITETPSARPTEPQLFSEIKKLEDKLATQQ